MSRLSAHGCLSLTLFKLIEVPPSKTFNRRLKPIHFIKAPKDTNKSQYSLAEYLYKYFYRIHPLSCTLLLLRC